MRTWQPHTRRLNALVFSPDGKLLATTAGDSKAVWLWDATTGALVRKLLGNEYPARAVAFSPDGKHLAGMQAGPDVRVWEIETGKVVSVLAVVAGGAKSLAFSPDGAELVAVTSRVGRWRDPAAPPTPTTVIPRPPDESLASLTWTEQVDFTPSGRLVVACRGSVIITTERGASDRRVFANPVGWATVNGFAFTRDETRLAVAYQSTIAAVFDLTDPLGRAMLLRGHKQQQVRAIGFTPDGQTVVTVGNDGTSRFWDATTGTQLRVFDWGMGVLAVACFAPDGLTCAAGSAKGKVIVWDVDA
jgi:DNA-binding beta-propeller fold protein YncE